MPKKQQWLETKVIVELDLFRPTLDSAEEVGREVIREIKRHVDGVGHVYPEVVYEEFCEFCDSHWLERDVNYNGGCCEQDVVAWEEAKCGPRTSPGVTGTPENHG